MSLYARGDHFRFGSVFIKKNNQTEIFFFEKKKPKPGQTDRFRFGFFRAKTGLARFFQFWLDFLGFGSVFSGFGSVFFGLARFFAYKTKTEPAGFFKNLIGLIGFFSVRFFRLFFFRFSRFNRFSSFFAHPYYMPWKVRLVKLKKEEG
jgi:hypothetical protein